MYILIVLLSIVVDQYSKHLAIKHLKVGGFKIYGQLEFRYVENRGAAMGLLKNHPLFLKSFTVVLLIVLILYEVKAYYAEESMLLLTAMSLVIGGGAGNLIDRFHRGFVVDFYSFKIKKLPYFNIADFFVILGGILFIVSENLTV